MKALEERLEKIKGELLELHRLSKRAVELTINAISGDEVSRYEVEKIEKQADVLNTDIENDSLSAVALFQPVAKDLRFLSTVMRLSGNYERITDLAWKVARFRISEGHFAEKLKTMQIIILEMFDIVEKALEGDTGRMRDELIFRDDRLDTLKEEVIDDLLGSELTHESLSILLSAIHFERIGDILSKNGARIIFINEGRRVWIK